MPCISVVMPVYNNEKYFPLAVKSILDQDYQDYELIVIDDGSTDNTPYIADELATHYPCMKVIHQKNMWIYASFNRGIQESNGEYIYIVNSDDRLCPGALSLMAESVEKYHPDVVWTKVIIHSCDQNQQILNYNIGNLDGKVLRDSVYLEKDEVRKAWPYFVKSLLAQNQANLYRRSLMEAHPFRNDVYGADTLFNISIASDVQSAVVLSQAVYEFFIYERADMNASVGKYYTYEHDMFNEIYTELNKLFTEWEIPENEYKGYLTDKRMREITGEIRSLGGGACKLTTEEKLQRIFVHFADETMIKCAIESDREEELESRILSGVREFLLLNPLEEDSKMYFVFELLDSLLKYEKEDMDYQKIENAINHPFNPAHIGHIFYDKLTKR